MRMVARCGSRAEAEERAAFLRAHGIATHVTGIKSLRLDHGPRFEAGLWVLLEAQYDDAHRLLADPDHKVANPLTPEQLTQLETEGASNARSTMIRWLIAVAVGLSLLAWLASTLGRAVT